MKLIYFVFISLLISSCTHRVLDFTLISTKNVDLSSAATFERGNNRVEGIDMAHWIIVFPTGTVQIKEAVDRAIESTPGCVALLDGVVYSKFWWIPYIYGQQAISVEGTPLIDPSLASKSQGFPNYGMIHIDSNGNIESVNEITPKEFFAYKEKITTNTEKLKFKNSIKLN